MGTTWHEYTIHEPTYVKINARGPARYREGALKKIDCVKLEVDTKDAEGLTKLILFSNALGIPVNYDFNEHKAWIALRSA